MRKSLKAEFSNTLSFFNDNSKVKHNNLFDAKDAKRPPSVVKISKRDIRIKEER